MAMIRQQRLTIPEVYAAQPDGTVNLQVDCKPHGGAYTPDGSSLTIEVATMTRGLR